MLRRIRAAAGLALLASAVVLGACFDNDEDPERDFIMVRNDSSTEARVRIKLWQTEFKAVSSGKAERIEFDSEVDTVQVEAKSRKQWDDCWVTMQVGQTLVVFDGGERIACRVEK